MNMQRLKLKEVLIKYFPQIKQNIVIADNSFLNKVLNETFKNDIVTYVLEPHSTVTKHNILPLITPASRQASSINLIDGCYMYFVMPYENLMNFLHKNQNNEFSYFVTVKNKFAFVVTDDEKLINKTVKTYLNGEYYHKKDHFFKLDDDVIFSNKVEFKNYDDISISTDDMIVVNKYYKSINGETVTVVLNSNMDFHHEMSFKYSKEIYPLQRQYGGNFNGITTSFCIENSGLNGVFNIFHEYKAPTKLNIKVEIYVNPEWKMGLK